MPIPAGSRIGGDQIIGSLRIGPRWVFSQDLISCPCGIIGAAWVFGATVSRRDVGNVLRRRDRHLWWPGEVLGVPDPEITLVLNVPTHDGHMVERAGSPGRDGGDRYDGTGHHRAGHIEAIGVRSSLKRQDLRSS